MSSSHKKRKKKTGRVVAGGPPPQKAKSRSIWLNVLPDQHWFRVKRGMTLLDALKKRDIEIEADCNGLGKCGKCKVKVESAVGLPTPEEIALLDEEELNMGIRLACRTIIRRDMVVDLGDSDPEKDYFQILKTGNRPILQLEPLIDLQLVPPLTELAEEGISDLDRIKLVLGPEYGDLTASLHCLRNLPGMLQQTDFDGAVVLHEKHMLAWRPWGKMGRRYGLAFDLGTTTLVGKLISLLDTSEIAVISRLNSQIKHGSNVVSRLQFVKERKSGLDMLHTMLMRDLNAITKRLLEVGKIEPDDVFVAVAAGNTTMQHLLLRLPCLGIAEAPFTPVLTDGIIVNALDIGLHIHPEGLLYVMPTRSGYIGGDLMGVIIASGAAEQDTQMVLALDLGTNGELFLGNRRRLLTCSAAAGPALEGSKISDGMIAKTGAIEGVSVIDDTLVYRVIGNTRPKGICGSGLVDLIAVLLHWEVIDYEGLMHPPHADLPEDIASRIVPDGDVYKFIVARHEESFNGRLITLTQQDIREVQLAKGAIAAGVNALVDEMGIYVDDIDRIDLAGALGNYLHPLSAMRIGIFPMVSPHKINSLGNAAGTGATMALLSRDRWKRANELADTIEHLELSSRPDFNDSFVENLDFPTENTW
jgi:uncharacterized 2Fe-2S/4Fe-4S cluster protein (DUF4445 family)